MKSDGKRQLSYEITYICNLKYDINKLICKPKTDSYTEKKKTTHGHYRGKGEGVINEEFGISRCVLLYIKQINKVLLYSTGSPFNVLQRTIKATL